MPIEKLLERKVHFEKRSENLKSEWINCIWQKSYSGQFWCHCMILVNSIILIFVSYFIVHIIGILLAAYWKLILSDFGQARFPVLSLVYPKPRKILILYIFIGQGKISCSNSAALRKRWQRIGYFLTFVFHFDPWIDPRVLKNWWNFK